MENTIKKSKWIIIMMGEGIDWSYILLDYDGKAREFESENAAKQYISENKFPYAEPMLVGKYR